MVVDAVIVYVRAAGRAAGDQLEASTGYCCAVSDAAGCDQPPTAAVHEGRVGNGAGCDKLPAAARQHGPGGRTAGGDNLRAAAGGDKLRCVDDGSGTRRNDAPLLPVTTVPSAVPPL